MSTIITSAGRKQVEDTEWLERQYRILYWECNELDLIGNEYAIAEANRLRLQMNSLCNQLGYTPNP